MTALKLITIMLIKQYCVTYFGFFTKEITKSCDKGKWWLINIICIHSAARVNQFGKKDTCIEFLITVSRQDNKVKIKSNLKITWQRLQS